jgi:hypothetical protein
MEMDAVLFLAALPVPVYCTMLVGERVEFERAEVGSTAILTGNAQKGSADLQLQRDRPIPFE